MGLPIKLKDNEQQLKNQLQSKVNEYWSIINNNPVSCDGKKLKELIMQMAEGAHQLHMLLLKRRMEPKHHKYMIKNRGCQPNDPEFYRHIHSVEDLLSFIDDRKANDDPIDTTIGKEFDMRVYTRRWGHDDVYKLKRIDTGWHIKALSIEGDCDKFGSPFLFQSLNHDGVCYPKHLGDFMEWLWDKAAEEGLKEKDVQRAMDQISKWISLCERNVPRGLFKGLI